MTVELPVFSFAAIIAWAVVVAVAVGYVIAAHRYVPRHERPDVDALVPVAVVAIGPLAALVAGLAAQLITEGWS